MTFTAFELLALGVGYLFLLFLVAYVSESGLVPMRWVRHPLVYVLSLGVYVSAWGIYAVVGFAYQSGYNFLAFYLGISGAFLLAPVLLAPIARLVQTYQLGSLADLFAYRYRSQLAGSLTTLAMVVGMMPLLALQIRAVAESAEILVPGLEHQWLALVFCLIISAFTVLFGARHLSPREKHEGLVVAIAAESVIKLVAMSAVGWFAFSQVFDGHVGLNQWLDANPHALSMLYDPLKGGFWHSLILAFLFSAVVMPFMYQMTFTENFHPRALLTASWGLPLYLIIMALGVPVLMWAGMRLELGLNPEYFTLGVALAAQSPWLPMLVFLGGLAAASGIIIVSTLAMASMVLNHLVLPVYQPRPDQNIYRWILWVRRLLIAGLIVVAFGFYVLLDERRGMTEMAMLTFVATLQFAPGLIGVLFWPRANRIGFVSGLIVGMTLWFATLVVPYLIEMEALPSPTWLTVSFADNPLYWQTMGLGATLVNAMVGIVMSLLTPQSASEQIAANTCSVDNLRRPYRWELGATSTGEFVRGLAEPLGRLTAEREVMLALADLGMTPEETRPYALRRLRDQIESNLSGLLGPSVAQDILDQHLPYKVRTDSEGSAEDIHYIESRLEDYRHRLSGLAGELDSLRRFHRQTLYDLPIGVCSLGKDMEILSWNHAMMQLTGISDESVIGSRLSSLPAPWREMFLEFLLGPSAQVFRKPVQAHGETHWVSLNRAVIGEGDSFGHPDSQVIVVEDISELHRLEVRLSHNERLASIGRLAAGVAHEIGNPVTGIACLAQNLKAESADPDIRDASHQILEQTQRISRIVQSLVGFARAENLNHRREPVELNSAVDEAIQLLQLGPEGRDYEFANECRAGTVVAGDRQRLIQVFINLLTNARDASPKGSRIIARAATHGPRVRFEVEDFGSGLPQGEIRAALFEPFVTTKDTGKGTGLGLALVHGIVEEHEGRIQLIDKADYDQGQGVIVQITLLAWQNDGDTPAESA
ncbi:MAG: ATP-binding protein [Moraxellaceae bacterium]|nr:ATP-binding protein [Moraxellaceae bacterium]